MSPSCGLPFIPASSFGWTSPKPWTSPLRPERGEHALRSRRTKPYRTRRPGATSPLWNVCATKLRRALARRGAKARLARYLGIPRQRLTDFLLARTRLPDAELTLRMLHWLAAHQAGCDLSL